MEEKEAKQTKLTYEQLEQAALALQQRGMQLEAQINSFNYTAMRLDYLFKVVKYSTEFSTDFIKYCTDEIEKILRVNAVTEK